MKKAFVEGIHLSPANVERLLTINEIIEEYAADGYRLTLRQLYYQLVSKGIIPNKTQEYAKLSTILKNGRMAGVVDWDAIEDRVRKPHIPYWVYDIPDALNDVVSQYRLDRMYGQDSYIEVWVEKDALSGVLSRVTEYYHVRLMVNRGYSSTTAMYDAAERLRSQADNGRDPLILYLGDHDPSGLDMIRDISDRLAKFGITATVTPVALTHEQINQYDPPPNPAKVSDPRATGYIKEHGRVSWEVDALNPRTLLDVVGNHIRQNIDIHKFESMMDREKADIKELQTIISSYQTSGAGE